MVDRGGGVRRGEGDLRLSDGDGDRHDWARRVLIGAVTDEGGVVGAVSGGGPARGEADLAGGVGDVGGVVVADVVEVVVDGDVFSWERRSTTPQGGVEGDLLIDDGGGVGRGEGESGRHLGDVNGDDGACRILIGAVASEGGVVGACTGRAKARGDRDLAGGVGDVGGVVVADVVEVVVDGGVFS